MKRLLVPLFLLMFTFSAFCGENDDCDKHGPCPPCNFVSTAYYPYRVFQLSGKVRVIPPESNEYYDILVYVSKPGEVAELVVKWVEPSKDFFYYCGYWIRVDSGEDFTIKFTNDVFKADISIRYGDPYELYYRKGLLPGL